MELHDLTQKVSELDMKFLSPSENEALKFVVVPAGNGFSRKTLDSYVESAKLENLRLGWVKMSNGDFSGGVSKIFKNTNMLKLKDGEIALVCAGKSSKVNEFLGKIRTNLSKELDLIPKNSVKILWIVDFPMFEWNDDENRYQAQHHPFTMPYAEDLEKYPNNLDRIRAHAYDLVINGWELGSGSVRIHRKSLQEKVFKLIGLSETEARERFGFFLEAFEYGAPPHAGFAIGIDRLVAIMRGAQSLRDVIAFPKTTSGTDLMANAPSKISEEQLKELGIRLEVDK